MTPYWNGGWATIRTKGLGGARTTLSSRKKEEKWVGMRNWGPQAAPVDQQNWSRTLLSLAVQLLKTGCRPPWSAAHVSSSPVESSSAFHLAWPRCLRRPAQWGTYRGTSLLLEKMVTGHRGEKLI